MDKRVHTFMSAFMSDFMSTFMSNAMHTGRQPTISIAVTGRHGGRTSIAVRQDEYDEMLHLARGSSADCKARVTEVCREAAETLLKSGYAGAWSPAVRRRALAILRGSYVPDRAARHDRAHATKSSEEWTC